MSSILDKVRTVAIDVDSVLADVMLVWVEEYNRRKSTKITKHDITRWDIPTVLPITPDEVYEYFIHVWRNRWKEIPPTEENIGSITERLHRKGYRVSIITKRERPTVAYVAKWLDHNNIYADDLLFVFDPTPKSEYPFDILIDDAPKNLIDVTPPKTAILFNQPWNRDFTWQVRVNTLSEAECLL